MPQLFASHLSSFIRLFPAMRRRVRNLFVRKSDKKTGQAAVAEDADDAVYDPLDDTALGLDVWVQGVNPIVEYVPPSLQSHLPACTALVFILLTVANRPS
jgi:hypothetical protein